MINPSVSVPLKAWIRFQPPQQTWIISMKHQYIFQGKSCYFYWDVRTFSICVCGNKSTGQTRTMFSQNTVHVGRQCQRLLWQLDDPCCLTAPPSVSFQTNPRKCKSCESDQLTPHLSISPSVCVSSFHHFHPSFVQSTHQQQWCAVIIVRPYVRVSVYMQDPSG